MNGLDIFQHNAFQIALVVLVAFIIFWLAKKLLRLALILLIVGFLIWHFWLS